LFHGLDIAAVMVLGGIALALWRRMRDRGALTLQDFSADFLPLIMLFAISVTGLALTASVTWLRGAFFGFLAILHAITVIGALLYLPFGKFFHIFQRPAQLGVKLYQEAGERDEGAHCARCGQRYASQMQIEDLQRCCPRSASTTALPDGPAKHWTELCPACKRDVAGDRAAENQGGLVAKPPLPTLEINEKYGPHGNYAPPGGWDRTGSMAPAKLVKTHCSFCGQQCGIQLKVRDNQVVGFEPWEDFPYNRGMLCPKGVKRYSAGHSSGPADHAADPHTAGLSTGLL
jgi:hypothetical protein